MKRPIFAAAVVALIAIPVVAQAQVTAKLDDERGIKVVERNENTGGSNQLFAVRPPQGVQPGGNGNANENGGGSGNNQLFAVRPPQGVEPGGNGNATENGGGNGEQFLVRPPQGIEPENNGGGNAGGRPEQPQQLASRPQITIPGGIGGSTPAASVPTPREEVVAIPTLNEPKEERVEVVSTEALTVEGVESGIDLYNLLKGRGYKVTVQHTANPDHYLLLAHEPHHRFAHVLLVDDEYGSILKHERVHLANYADGYGAYKAHKKVYAYEPHKKVYKSCDNPYEAHRVAYTPYRTARY